jgi:hypothetical protein
MKLASIIGIQGVGWLSDHIRAATGNGPLSHVGLCISTDGLVIEALARVRTRFIGDTIKDARHAWLIEPLTLTEEQCLQIVAAAVKYSADDYAYINIAWQGLDALFKTIWFTKHLATRKKAICSELVGIGYEACLPTPLMFGVDDKTVSPNNIWTYASAHPNKYLIDQLK